MPIRSANLQEVSDTQNLWDRAAHKQSCIQQGETKGCPLSRQEDSDSLETNRPKRRPLTQASPAGCQGSRELEVDDARGRTAGSRARTAYCARSIHVLQTRAHAMVGSARPSGRVGLLDSLSPGCARGGTAPHDQVGSRAGIEFIGLGGPAASAGPLVLSSLRRTNAQSQPAVAVRLKYDEANNLIDCRGKPVARNAALVMDDDRL